MGLDDTGVIARILRWMFVALALLAALAEVHTFWNHQLESRIELLESIHHQTQPERTDH